MSGRVPSLHGSRSETGDVLLPPLHCVQVWCVAYRRVRRVHLLLLQETFWVLLGVLCVWEVLALPVFPLMSTRLESHRCASCWSRPLGGGWRGHSLRDPGELSGLHPGEIAGKIYARPLFSRFGFFLCSRNSSFWWCGTPFLWFGRARHPGPGALSFAVEVLNVGGWLTHGDLALDTKVDFLGCFGASVDPARVRGEWARLCRMGLATVWAPASQDTSHVGHATFATAQFKRFFDCGCAVRCMLPLERGRFLHLVVLYGYQGAGADAEQLALTDHLLDAALGELGVVAREQPRLVVGDF